MGYASAQGYCKAFDRRLLLLPYYFKFLFFSSLSHSPPPLPRPTSPLKNPTAYYDEFQRPRQGNYPPPPRGAMQHMMPPPPPQAAAPPPTSAFNSNPAAALQVALGMHMQLCVAAVGHFILSHHPFPLFSLFLSLPLLILGSCSSGQPAKFAFHTEFSASWGCRPAGCSASPTSASAILLQHATAAAVLQPAGPAATAARPATARRTLWHAGQSMRFFHRWQGLESTSFFGSLTMALLSLPSVACHCSLHLRQPWVAATKMC